MAILENIEVRVVSGLTGNQLEEYHSPAVGEGDCLSVVEKYIQANDNEEFGIVIVLKAGFDYHGADGIQYTYKIDGNTSRNSLVLLKPLGGIKYGILLEDITYKKNTIKTQQNGRWYDNKFTFGLVTVGKKAFRKSIWSVVDNPLCFRREHQCRYGDSIPAKETTGGH